MAEEEQHETFEAVGSGASLTYPLQVCICFSLSLLVFVAVEFRHQRSFSW